MSLTHLQLVLDSTGSNPAFLENLMPIIWPLAIVGIAAFGYVVYKQRKK